MSYIDSTLEKLLEFRNLSFDEAENAMEEIMKGEVSPVKLSSWLTALRMKVETPEEIAGCAAGMRKHSKSIVCNDPAAVDIVGTGGDRSFSINISTAAAFIAAGAGVTVAKHGNRSVSSKSGSADVLGALGININTPPEITEECLNSTGIAFLYAPLLHPAVKHAMPVRKELGVRTVFNILGPLANPARVKHYVLGVFNEKLCMPVAKAGLNLGFKRSFIVHGSDGLDEITVTGSTHVCEINGGEVSEYRITPEEFDLPLALPEELKGGTPEENAGILKGILSGKITGAKCNIAILNADRKSVV